MFRFSASRSYSHLLFAGFVVVVATYGCGGDFSPTAPSLTQQPANGASFGSESSAVVSGYLTVGGGSASAGYNGGFGAAVTPSAVGGLTITVQGTTIKTTTDASGNFRLVNVPSGNIVLQITGAGTNVTVTVQGVGANQHVVVQIQLGPSSATIVTDERTELQQFNSVVTLVVLVDSLNGTVGLIDGTTVVVDDYTWWDSGGDYFNLMDLETAVLEGKRVEAKGQGTPDEFGQILASVIRAKLTEEEFEGVVSSARFSGVDPDDGTIVLVANLKGGVAEVRVDGATVWDPNGDLTSFDDLFTAFTKGLLINVEGKGALDAMETFILAGEIKAELEERDFEGIVYSATGPDADGVGTIVLFSNDKGPITTILVDGDTVWEGDVSSLTELIAALAGPFPVKVEGEGWLAADETFILATRIKVEIEDEDTVCDDRYATQVGAIDDLIDLVREVAEKNGLNGGQTNAFVSKLENAAKSLEKCNATPAANQLGAFINQVNAFVGSGKLLTADGVLLVSAAQAIINAINAAG